MAISKAKMLNLLENSRPGDYITPEGVIPFEKSPLGFLKGIQLSEIIFKPLEWFKYNPDNQIFRGCKTEEYFAGLKKDIKEANAILNPVIAMPDGLLIEGESRHTIAGELVNEGLEKFARIPCRIVLSKISKAKIKERLYLGNLSRFDVPPYVRLMAYAEIWPDYFFSTLDGREKNTVTTNKEIAAVTGMSESKIRREKVVIQEAAKIAKKAYPYLSTKRLNS